jgi:hypothetical protein
MLKPNPTLITIVELLTEDGMTMNPAKYVQQAWEMGLIDGREKETLRWEIWDARAECEICGHNVHTGVTSGFMADWVYGNCVKGHTTVERLTARIEMWERAERKFARLHEESPEIPLRDLLAHHSMTVFDSNHIRQRLDNWTSTCDWCHDVNEPTFVVYNEEHGLRPGYDYIECCENY